MNNKDIKTVVVLGMHRSGTSIVAGVLHKLGVNMGKNFLNANPGNVYGYYENVNFVELNKKILGHKDNTVLGVPPQEEILSKDKLFLAKIKNLIKQEESEIWGWKDPRTCLTIDLYLPYLINPYFILCFRNPLDVAYSLQKRDNLDILEGLNLCLLYDNRITNFVQKNRNLKYLFLSYGKLINNPEDSIQEIINFLNINVDIKLYNQAINFINPSKTYKKFYILKYYLKQLILHPEKLFKYFKNNVFNYNRKL